MLTQTTAKTEPRAASSYQDWRTLGRWAILARACGGNHEAMSLVDPDLATTAERGRCLHDRRSASNGGTQDPCHVRTRQWERGLWTSWLRKAARARRPGETLQQAWSRTGLPEAALSRQGGVLPLPTPPASPLVVPSARATVSVVEPRTFASPEAEARAFAESARIFFGSEAYRDWHVGHNYSYLSSIETRAIIRDAQEVGRVRASTARNSLAEATSGQLTLDQRRAVADRAAQGMARCDHATWQGRLWAIRHNAGVMGLLGGTIVAPNRVEASLPGVGVVELRVDDDLQLSLVQGECNVRHAGRMARIVATRDGALVMPRTSDEERALQALVGGKTRLDAVREAWTMAVRHTSYVSLPAGLEAAAKQARSRWLKRGEHNQGQAPVELPGAGAVRLARELERIREKRASDELEARRRRVASIVAEYLPRVDKVRLGDVFQFRRETDTSWDKYRQDSRYGYPEVTITATLTLPGDWLTSVVERGLTTIKIARQTWLVCCVQQHDDGTRTLQLVRQGRGKHVDETVVRVNAQGKVIS